MLLFGKEKTIEAFKNVTEKGLMDKDLIIVKLQNLVSAGELTEEDVQPVVNMVLGVSE